MENKNYNIVVDYISNEFDLNKSELKPNTSLSDIGLDGDDVLDFLLKFFKTFGIEYEKTNYKNFILTEDGFVVSTLLSLFILFRRKRDENEIFIKDLVISLGKKKWYKKPEY